MSFHLLYHHLVERDDIPKLPKNLHQRISQAIMDRLSTEPQRYGQPLRGSLKGYWKLRVGDYRVIFKIIGPSVHVLAIVHRSRVYTDIFVRI